MTVSFCHHLLPTWLANNRTNKVVTEICFKICFATKSPFSHGDETKIFIYDPQNLFFYTFIAPTITVREKMEEQSDTFAMN